MAINQGTQIGGSGLDPVHTRAEKGRRSRGKGAWGPPWGKDREEEGAGKRTGSIDRKYSAAIVTNGGNQNKFNRL